MIFRETLELRKSEYVYGGVYLELFDLQEGPYATVTTCLSGYTSDYVIAFNHDFADFYPELLQELIDTLTDGEVGEVQSGFVTFKLYVLKDHILDNVASVERG